MCLLIINSELIAYSTYLTGVHSTSTRISLYKLYVEHVILSYIYINIVIVSRQANNWVLVFSSITKFHRYLWTLQKTVKSAEYFNAAHFIPPRLARPFVMVYQDFDVFELCLHFQQRFSVFRKLSSLACVACNLYSRLNLDVFQAACTFDQTLN